MRSQKLVLKTLVISIAAAISAPVLAETTEKKTTKLPRINVVGEPNSLGAISKQPGSVTIVTEEDLEMIQPLSTEDALRTVPGVNVKGEEETGIVTNVGIRGLSAAEQKTLILEDGVPVAPGLFIGNGRYYNPRIQRMESIEVLKGASSLRYGPSTVGGVINYQTKTPKDGVTISGRAGSHNYYEANLEAGGSTPSGDAFAGIFFTNVRSDGFMGKGYDTNDLMVKGGMALGNNQWISAKFSHYDNDANISYRGLLLDQYNDGSTDNPAPDDRYKTDRNAFDINHEWQINDNAKLRTLLYWSEVTRDYWRYGVDTDASNAAGHWVYTDDVTGNNRSFDRYGLDSRLTLDYEMFNIPNETEIGIRALTESSNDTRIRATREQDRTGPNDRHRQDSADSVAVYAQNRFSITDRFDVTLGLRVESYSQKRKILTDNNDTETTSNTEFLPGLGATYQLAPLAQVYGSIYNAFTPATNAVALDGMTDQQLEAERSTNVEIGMRGANKRFSYEIAAFQMDFSNQVVDNNSDPNLSQTNGGKTRHQGMEAAAGYNFGLGISLDANVTYIPVSKFVGGEYGGNRIAYSPEILANVELGYQVGGLRSALLLHHTGEQYGNSANTEEIPDDAAGGIWGGKLDAYTTLNFTASYDVTRDFNVFGAVKNITDERYIAGLRQGIYVGPDRSFELGAKYTF